MPRVDLVIPTHNGSDHLRRCLRSLAESTYTDYQVIVFDDGSTEAIADLIERESPGAIVIRSERNIGLAAGCNRAIAAGSAEFVVLLNNDTEVEPHWLAELVACADRHPTAGSVASKLRLLSDRTRIHSAGDTYSVRGMPGNRGVWLEDVGQYDREEEVLSACAGAALYRRDALESVSTPTAHPFDERLFMYCEDVDLGWRLQRAGYRCVFAPRAVVYHALSATGGGALASYWVARNVWLVLARSVPRGLLRPYRARVLAFQVGRTVRALRHSREPAARATLRGSLVGIALAATSRDSAPFGDDDTRQRVAALLSDPSPPALRGR